MNETEIKRVLDELATCLSSREAALLKSQSEIQSLFTEDIQKRMKEIESRSALELSALSGTISTLEDKIKQAVISHGQSVKGTTLHAVYAKGRVTWDSKSLEGFAVAHPEIGAFRKEGAPTVSIRRIGADL